MSLAIAESVMCIFLSHSLNSIYVKARRFSVRHAKSYLKRYVFSIQMLYSATETILVLDSITYWILLSPIWQSIKSTLQYFSWRLKILPYRANMNPIGVLLY